MSRQVQFSRDYYTVNVSYRLPAPKRKEFHDLMKHIDPTLPKRTQARMTEPQAEALAEVLRRWDIPVEVNKTCDLDF
jgi:hypothetical protein